MDDNRYQMYLQFTGKEVPDLMEVAQRYKRKPAALGKLIIQDWIRAVRAANLPPLIDLVPVDTFTSSRKEGK